MKKFEYKQEKWFSIILNEEGSEGWELCGVTPRGDYIFKREIQEVKTLDQTLAVGKRIQYSSEDVSFDTGIITKIDEQGVWVLWDSDHEELWIYPESFSNGEARIIE